MTTNYAQAERHQLADLLLEVGPGAPTLCEGWNTGDLVAHLLVRERRPDAAVGMLVPPLAERGERIRRSVRDGARWADQVERLRNGPPLPVRFDPLDRLMNTVEYFVHHEDVRRAAEAFTPRELPREEEEALWRTLRMMGRMMARPAPVGIRVRWPDVGDAVAKALTPTVTVVGPPSEIVLYLSGRKAVAQVTLEGDDVNTEALRNTKLGI